MKAISIQQPWAWAILHAGKDVENRTWAHNYRGPILIHASKKFDYEGYQWLLLNYPKITGCPSTDIPYCSRNRSRGKLNIPYQMGGIVGVSVIKKIVRSIDYSPWMFGPWGWVLENPKPIEFIPCRGQLGLFNVEIDNKRVVQTGASEAIIPASSARSAHP